MDRKRGESVVIVEMCLGMLGEIWVVGRGDDNIKKILSMVL